MPGTAQAIVSTFSHLADASSAAPTDGDESLTRADLEFLLRLQRQALQYFLDNQMPNGLMLDRQHNHGPRMAHGLCSTAATGMGFIALAVASAPPYRMLSHDMAVRRISAGIHAVLERLPHEHGAVPHFIDSASGAILGIDYYSTIETAWLAAGALWAAAFLRDSGLETLAVQLYRRIDWHYWTASGSLLRHGMDRAGRFLVNSWDRVNGETAFMYVLAAGADEGKAITRDSWQSLRPFYGAVAGHRFNNADLGLFVFQYGLDLLHLHAWQAPGEPDLHAEAVVAARANREACREAADRFATYRRFWGLSAGDGPSESSATDTYRCYAPAGPIDGTAHLTATVASVGHYPAAVMTNLYEARHDRRLPLRGRYGFSNVNVDHAWVGHDMVGIDAGAAVLALDNYLMHDRVRTVFHSLPCVQRGLERLGFTPRTDLAHEVGPDPRPTTRRAS